MENMRELTSSSQIKRIQCEQVFFALSTTLYMQIYFRYIENSRVRRRERAARTINHTKRTQLKRNNNREKVRAQLGEERCVGGFSQL